MPALDLPSRWASLVAQRLKCLPSMWVQSLGDPWRRKWQPTPVLLPGESHGQRCLVGYRSWGRKELDTTSWLYSHFLPTEKEGSFHAHGWHCATQSTVWSIGNLNLIPRIALFLQIKIAVASLIQKGFLFLLYSNGHLTTGAQFFLT